MLGYLRIRGPPMVSLLEFSYLHQIKIYIYMYFDLENHMRTQEKPWAVP